MAMAVAAENLALEHMRLWAANVNLDSGQPIVLDAFEEDFIADVFDGFPECWLIVPEENGKTTLMALLALYHVEHRRGAYVPVAASSREQAEILYKQAEGFIIQTPQFHAEVHSELMAIKGKQKTVVPRFKALEGYRRVNHFRGGRMQVFAADDDHADGAIGTFFIVEELHRHKNLNLYRTWAGKLRKRGAQIIVISTAGEPGSEFETTRERIRQRATDVQRRPGFTRYVSGSVVMHEYALPEDADVTNMEQVKLCNPARRITSQTLAAKFSSPTMTMAHWRRFVCNVPTRGEDAAITEIEWQRARVDDIIPAGISIWIGLDVAWKLDTTSAVPYWERDDDYRLLGPALVLTPPRDGTMLHPDAIKDGLRAIHKRNPIHTVVMDMSYAADIAAWISDELGAEVIDRPQSNPLAAHEFATFMGGLRNGWLHHTGDPALTQHALNAATHLLPGGDARFDRSNQSRHVDQERRVIDALKAAAMVVAQKASLGAPVEDVEPWVIVRGGRQ